MRALPLMCILCLGLLCRATEAAKDATRGGGGDLKQEVDPVDQKQKHAQYMRYYRAVTGSNKRKISPELQQALSSKKHVSLFDLWVEHNEDPLHCSILLPEDPAARGPSGCNDTL
jgi:hypothetical protein